MKTLRLMLMILTGLWAGLMVGCKDEDETLPEPTLSIPVKALNLKALSSDTTFTITSNYDWTATCPETDTWCKLTKEKEKLHIALEVNLDTVARSTRITVTVEGGEAKKVDYIDVTQAAPDRSVVSLSTDKLSFETTAGTKEVMVLTNAAEYTFQFAGDSLVNWCTPEKEGYTLKVSVTENVALEDRMAQLVVTAGTGKNLTSTTLDIIQLGQHPSLSLPDTITLPANNDPYPLEIVTNQSTWRFSTMFLNEKWVVCSKDENEENILILQGVGYDITENTGELEVYAGEGVNEVRKRVHVIKKASPVATISVDRANVTFMTAGGTMEVAVTASIDNWSFTPPADADWLTIEKKGNKLVMTAVAGEEELRETTVVLMVGGGDNLKTLPLTITQAGSKPFVGLSVTSVVLDEQGTEQSVIVSSNSGVWRPIIPAEASEWLHYRMEGNVLYLSAEPVESGSRSVEITVGAGETGEEAPVTLTVTQNKLYQVWDYYVLNGEKIGIVFAVSDGGLHGKVMALKANHEVNLIYSNLRDASPLVATNKDNGQENIRAMKEVADWKQAYPAAAWVDDQNDANGKPGWYMPAINELRTLDMMYSDGWEKTMDNEDAPENAVASRERLNQMITEAGGVPFVFVSDGSEIQNALRYIMSSTEERYQGWPNYWARSPWGDNQAFFREVYMGLPYDSASIRPILAF